MNYSYLVFIIVLDLRKQISSNGLKVTPQRIAVLETIVGRKDHPTAQLLIEEIQQKHPNIAVGTVYKILETFVEKGIIHKVKTVNDVMRYDGNINKHHHLYCPKSDKIQDYQDDELIRFIRKYFENKKIPNFDLRDIQLQIIGEFKS